MYLDEIPMRRVSDRYLKALPADSVLAIREGARQNSLRKIDGFIRIVYAKEKTPLEFGPDHQSEVQTSWIELDPKMNVSFNYLGHIDNPMALKKHGYWAWERFAEELPLDYLPQDSQD